MSSDEHFKAQSAAVAGVDVSTVSPALYTSDESVNGDGDADTVMQVSAIQVGCPPVGAVCMCLAWDTSASVHGKSTLALWHS